MYYNYLSCKVKRQFEIDKIYSLFAHSYEKGYYFDGEAHDFWEIMCVLDGEIGVSLDDKIYSIKPNQLVLIRPMQFHRVWAQGNTNPRLFIVSFSLNTDYNFDGSIFDMSEVAKDITKRLFALGEDIFEFDYIFATAVKEGMQSKEHIFVNMLESFILTVCGQVSMSVNIVKSKKTEYFENIIAYLRENSDKKLNISEIARAVKMSTSNMKKIFNEFTGMGIAEYFTKLKINQAKNMLAEGCSSKEISRSLGFAEQNYFSAVFKKETGQSPRKWLETKQCLKNSNS